MKTIESRVQKLLKNISAGFFLFCIQLLIVFISRIFFIRYLSIQYLGIDDLYKNILSLLSLADLGFETVLMYSLYKPLYEKNYLLINQLLKTFKKIYKNIAIIIFVFGMLIVPFLPSIVYDTNLNNNFLRIYYLFFLLNTVMSYLMVYKTVLLQADQKISTVKLIKALIQLISGILQIIAIIIFKNYIYYLIIMIFGTLLNNIILSLIVDKQYKFLKKDVEKNFSSSYKNKLIEMIKSTFIYKIGVTLINSTDNILISIVAGTKMVGFYSNYFIIITALTSIVGILNVAIIPSIGNYLEIYKEGEKRETIFFTILLLYFIIATIMTISLLLNLEQFIKIWLGIEYLLDKNIEIVIIISFYFQCVAHPLWIFRETSGLFKEIKNCILIMATLNIILSYILGKELGILGVIGATVVARLLTLFWYEPKLLFFKIFNRKVDKYWFYWKKYFFISQIIIWILYTILKDKFLTIYGIIFKEIIILVLVIGVYFLCFKNTDEFIVILKKIKKGDRNHECFQE